MTLGDKSTLRKLFLDFESYYDDAYTLRKQTPFEYVLDPRFEALGCSFCWEDGDPKWVDGPDLDRFFKTIPWKHVHAISHNGLFDMVILSFKYQIKPALYGCTMNMATNLLRHATGRVSLDACCNYYGLPVKTDTILKMKGVTFAMLKRDPWLYPKAVEYCNSDVTKCRTIYNNMMADGFPLRQLEIVDMVIRMAAWPQLQLDEILLAEHLASVQAHKRQLLEAIGLETRDNIMRDGPLAAMLIQAGVTPPMKKSKTDPTKKIFAFAKTDKAFTDLLEHDDPDVQAIVAARLGHKSTLEETRTQRLIDIQKVSPLEFPIPLRYSGAHTHRFCLAGHMNITILRDCVVQNARLDALQPTDLVWDGEEFVAHGGLAYAGIKGVIEYDNVAGTPDHRVWTVEHGYCQLAEAKARGYDIARGGVPDPARVNPAVYRSDRIQDEDQVHLLQLQQGDAIELVEPARPHRGQVQSLPQTGGVLSLERSRLGARQAHGIVSPASLQRPEETGLQGLRRARDHVSVQHGSGDGGLGVVEPGTKAGGHIDRSDQQRQPLRAGQPPLGDAPAAEHQQAPTWDIVDCGPRNRFVVNGRVVHNSGDWKINMQNLPRTGRLRKAIKAQQGWKIVSVDSSQIEARLNAVLSGQTVLVEAFREGRDVYAEFAEQIYNQRITKEANPRERFVGKTGILSLGYASSWPVFQNMCRVQSNGMVKLTDYQCAQIVSLYRQSYPMIVNNWNWASRVVLPILAGESPLQEEHLQWGPVRLQPYEIILPNGNKLYYRDLRRVQNDEGKWQWQFMRGPIPIRTYGAKVVENVIQALAFVHLMDVALHVKHFIRGNWLLPVHQIHDELLYTVPAQAAPQVAAFVRQVMSVPPFWMPDAPLAAEAKIGDSYGGAK